MYFVSLMKFPDFCRFLKGSPFFYKILKTYMILLFLIIILIGLDVLKLVWSKNNASMNFRGGKMLKVNSVIANSGIQFYTLVYFVLFQQDSLLVYTLCPSL